VEVEASWADVEAADVYSGIRKMKVAEVQA
jgi:hypothetical protein